MRKIGCKLPWDIWSSEDFNFCSEVDELRSFSIVYDIMYIEDLYLIINRTGCPKPCQYKEYKLVGKEEYENEKYDQYIYFTTTEEVIIEKELLSYSGLSLLADIGGTLGMFLGFSFLMVWDAAEAAMLRIIHAWNAKTTLPTLEEN